jgi:dephospho-CoA kinase
MRTFGLISPMAAGKGTIANYLVTKYGAKTYNFSGPINEILKRLHIPHSRENQIKIGSSMREQYGEDVWAQTLKKDILKDNPNIAVIDGIRYPADLEISKTLPNFILVAVETDADKRFARLKIRSDRPGEDTLDRATFDTQHDSATERHIKEVMKEAHVVITNDGSLEELYTKIDNILKQ